MDQNRTTVVEAEWRPKPVTGYIQGGHNNYSHRTKTEGFVI